MSTATTTLDTPWQDGKRWLWLLSPALPLLALAQAPPAVELKQVRLKLAMPAEERAPKRVRLKLAMPPAAAARAPERKAPQFVWRQL